MKKHYLTLICFISIVAFCQQANATLLSDYFGINLSVNSLGKFNNSWIPSSSTADYAVGDWPTIPGAPNPSPFGNKGEAFDVEAMYVDDSGGNIYFSIVTSMPQSGYAGSQFGWPAYTFYPGDLAINLGGGTYQYGVKVSGPNQGIVKQGATWYYDKGNAGYPNGYPNSGSPMYPKFNDTTGTTTGYAQSFSYYDANLTERNYSTFVIEGVIPTLAFGNPAQGSTISLKWSPDCNNDYLYLIGDIDTFTHVDVVPVPEPSTFLMILVGLIGVFYIKIRRIN